MVGFDFSNHNRNLALHARGVPLPKATSTGTTIVGCVYDKGVVVSSRRCWWWWLDDEADGALPFSDRSRYQSYQWPYCGR